MESGMELRVWNERRGTLPWLADIAVERQSVKHENLTLRAGRTGLDRNDVAVRGAIGLLLLFFSSLWVTCVLQICYPSRVSWAMG